MPRLIEPSPDMPDSATRAQKALASLRRLEIAKFLLATPAATIVDVMFATGLGRNSAYTALRELQELGFVDSDEEAGPRRQYRINRRAVTQGVIELAGYLIG